MDRRLTAILTGVAICGLMLIATGSAAAKAVAPHYYIALGDSLSQGMQPDLKGATLDTTQGYTDDLAAIERGRVKNLSLVKFGCGGDSTTSLLTGHGNDKAARALHCNRTGGSQLAAAVSFLKAHHTAGEVPLVTIDIGANDVDGCVTAANLLTCITQGEASIQRNLPTIYNALRKAAPRGTTFAAMTLYDPILGGYFAPAGTTPHTLATLSVALVQQINTLIANADAKAGFLTADVAGAFNTYDSTDTVTWEGQQLPVNVATVCSWTWACQTPPSGPNIHANKNGYQVIANAYANVIGRRLR